MPGAARLFDGTSHGSPLLPGTGSPDVWIGGRPAWRATKDIHVCPIPEPPHGSGAVYAGSRSVFINGCSAVRQGDKVMEAGGGANTIISGEPTVLIGG